MKHVATTSVGQIGLDLVVNQNQFSKQMAGVQSLARKTGRMLAAAFGVNQLINFSKQCLELASDLQEVQNVVDVTFQTMNSDVDKFAKSAAASFGLSEKMAKQYTGTYGAMAKAFGFSEQQAYDMSTALTGLAGDVASFYNLSQDEAYTKLKSVFSGETETLKDLGVVMTQSALDAYALANGFDKTTKSMSEAEKVALRYAFMQSQLSAATGDFARTSNSWANQVKLLKLNLEQLGATIGGVLINVFKPLLSTLNVIISKFVQFAQAISDTLGKIFGWSYESTGGGIASDLETGAGSANDIASGLDNAAGSAKKLKQQLRGIDELNVISSGSDSGGSSSGGSASSGGSSSGTSSGWTQTDSIFDGNKIASDFASAFEDGFKLVKKIIEDFKVGDYFQAGEDTSKLVSGIFNFFAKAIDNVDWEGIGTNIGDFIAGIDWITILSSVGNLIWQAINAGIELWKGSFNAAPIEMTILTAIALLNFTGIGSIIATKFQSTLFPLMSAIGFEVGMTFLASFQASLGSKTALNVLPFVSSIVGQLGGIVFTVGGIVGAFKGFFSMLEEGFNWFDEIIMLAGIALTGVGAIILGAPALVTGVIAGIVAAVATAVILIKDNWEKIKKFFIDMCEKIKENFGEAWKKIEEIFIGAATWFDDHVIQPVVDFFVGFATRVGQIFKGLWIIIQAIWIIVSDWFNQNIIIPLINFFSPIVSKIGGFFTSLWNGIKAVWGSVSGWFNNNVIIPFQNAWNKATDKIEGFFAGLWNAIVRGIVAAMNAVIGGIESAINRIVRGINKIINGFNKVVSWAAKVAEVDWGGVSTIPEVSLKRISIKGYADGGFPEDGWFRAKHGEIIGQFDNGKSVVANNNQITEGISAAVYRGNQENNALMKQEILLLQKQNELLAKLLEKESGISIDDIFNSVRKLANDYTRRTGEPAFS